MRSTRYLWLAALLLTAGLSRAQAPVDAFPPAPPLPSDLPPVLTQPAPRVVNPRTITPRIGSNTNTVRFQLPQTQALPRGLSTNRLPRYTGPTQLPDGVLVWDEVNKEYHAKAGELTAPFSFAVTNASTEEVVINWVRPSCGCTVAKLPPPPWKRAPGPGGTIDLDVDLKGKHGILSKYVSVDTSRGQKMLGIKVHIPAAGQMAGGMDARMKNMQLAMADRQVVFRGECASCHSTPAIGKMGGELFAAACAVCHDTPHRATMVPDLKALTVSPTKEYWKHWITHGKPGSLMPAFSQEQGGPLTPEQIESLAEFLDKDYPQRKVAAAQAHAPGDGHDHDHEGHDHPVPAAGK